MTSTLTISLNGQPATFEEGDTIADVVRHLGHDPALPGVAVAVDGSVVHRRDWPATPLADGQRLEVLTAVQGGGR